MSEAERIINELNQFKEFTPFLMPPASEDELNSILWSELPDDYKGFLTIANGVQGPGIMLFGTVPQSLAGGQMEPDIILATQQARYGGLIETGKTFVLGHETGNLMIVYNGNADQYEIRDESDGRAVYEFTSLLSLVEQWASVKRSFLDDRN